MEKLAARTSSLVQFYLLSLNFLFSFFCISCRLKQLHFVSIPVPVFELTIVDFMFSMESINLDKINSGFFCKEIYKVLSLISVK